MGEDTREADPDSVLLAVARAMMAISLRAADALPGGISPVQLRALTVLATLRQANLAELAAALGISPSSTSRLCDRLVSGGLIDRQVSPRTRREIELSLSEEGATLLAAYDQHRLELLTAVVGCLGPRRRREVLAAFRDFTVAARALDTR